MSNYDGIDDCDPSLFDRTGLERVVIDERTTELIDEAGRVVVRNVLVEEIPSPKLPVPQKLIRS